jgi:60 kDa SS-A/Ro ribonucleoprotein
MASKTLFRSTAGRLAPRTDTMNEAGGRAFALPPKQALAQLAATGCLGHVFYATAEEQLDTVLALAMEVEPEYLAKLAIYARRRAFMKDMPALLCTVLAVRDVQLLKRIFLQVIDNGRMLRNFAQIIRSGQVGRKSFGTAPKKLLQAWINARPIPALFRDSVGNDPSLADVIKMVRPKAPDAEREAFYGWLIGAQDVQATALPELVRQFEAYKTTLTGPVPDVEFRLLTALPLTTTAWKEIAARSPWHMTRMNLNTFARHGVFDDPGLVKVIANRLRDENEVRRSRCFPYQLFAAYLNVDATVPTEVTNAIQDAAEIATQNVPVYEGAVYVMPDVSGSMSSPITGNRGDATSKIRCIDVAALVAACVLRRNPSAEVIPFETDVVSSTRLPRLNPRDSIMTNATKLAAIGGGGTDCSAPLRWLNKRKAHVDLAIFVSDNESWVDSGRRLYHGTTGTMQEWNTLVARKGNEQAKLVCIDIQPYASVQATDAKDRLNVGGFSDQVFEVIRRSSMEIRSTGCRWSRP